MKQVVATALVLLLLLFLLPSVFITPQPSPGEEQLPAGTLPPVHTPAPTTPTAASDAQTTVQVAMEDGSVAALTMDEYLWGVVAAEMPVSFALEALKAQAVAARTYTVAKMGHTVQAHPDAQVCTDITCCQAYITRQAALENWGDRGAEYAEKITQAVAGTDGMILTYQGDPIQAVFFSSAAGKTVDAVEVWGSDVPYLSSVDSPEGEEVPNYHSTVELSLSEFQQTLLAEYPNMALTGDPAGWVGEVAQNSAGGVASMTIGGVSVSGTALRALFNLRSTTFTLTLSADKAVFSVTGYGHGVGMSQYGANAMANQGKTWRDIVTWYYTGVEVVPMG